MEFNKENIVLKRFFGCTSGVADDALLQQLNWSYAANMTETELNSHPLVKLFNNCVELAKTHNVKDQNGKIVSIDTLEDYRSVYEFEYLGNTYFIVNYDGSYRLGINGWQESGIQINFVTESYSIHNEWDRDLRNFNNK